MISQLTEGFMLGIATGTTCLATCGPVYAPYLMQYERNFLKSVLVLIEISAGRFITYLIIGAVAGMVGSEIQLTNREWFTAAAYLLFSTFLIVTTIKTNSRERCCATGRWSNFVDRPVILGLLTGVNFCPSFLIALTKAVSLSGPVAGMALFTTFFLGTSLFLLPLSFFGLFGAKKLFRSIARICALAIGIWFIVQAGILIYKQVSADRERDIDQKLIINLMDDKPAFIYTNDTAAVSQLRSELASRKKTRVSVVTDTAALPDSGVIFTGVEVIAGKHVETNPMRRAGRFIAVLPDSSNHPLTKLQIGKLLDFLSFYSFKIDPDSGSIFVVPESVLK